MRTEGIQLSEQLQAAGFFLDPAPDLGSEGEIYRQGDVHRELTLLLDKLDRFQSKQL